MNNKEKMRKILEEIFEPNRFYTVEEIAKTLKKSKRTIYRWFEKGNLKGLKPKGINLVLGKELIEFLLKSESRN
jgi:excisionase family DNA binding protein